MQAAEARLAELGYHLCPHCDYEVEKDFLRCPNCMRKLKDPCKTCGKPLDPMWKICPFCESEIGAVPVQTRRTRRRSSTSEQPVAGPAAVAERSGSGIAERGGSAGLPERSPSASRAERSSTAASERSRPSTP